MRVRIGPLHTHSCHLCFEVCLLRLTLVSHFIEMPSSGGGESEGGGGGGGGGGEGTSERTCTVLIVLGGRFTPSPAFLPVLTSRMSRIPSLSLRKAVASLLIKCNCAHEKKTKWGRGGVTLERTCTVLIFLGCRFTPSPAFLPARTSRMSRFQLIKGKSAGEKVTPGGGGGGGLSNAHAQC